jgi:hypothetical protein
MRKRLVVYFLSFVFLVGIFSVIEAQENSDFSEEDVEKWQKGIDEHVPIDPETGEFDPSKYKSKAEERIEKINKYVGPITNFLFGVELTMSWLFLFSMLVWILLIELIVMPASEIFNLNVIGSLFAATIIATLAMQGYGHDFVIWMDSLMTQWYIGAATFVFGVIFAVFYSFIMKVTGKKRREMQKEAEEENKKRRMKELEVAADVAKQTYLQTR